MKEVATPAGHSDLAGTESLDQRWKQLEKYIPPEVHTKKNGEVDGCLWVYVYSWLWRHNLRGASLLDKLSELVAAAPVQDV